MPGGLQVLESCRWEWGRDPVKSPDPFIFSFLQTSASKLSSDSSPLLTFALFQGWVFNVVPWLVAIPTSLFSGFLSDHLINQGKSSFGFSSALILYSVGTEPGWEDLGLFRWRSPSNRQQS